MALTWPLVANLPTDWVVDSIITPNGTEVALPERYGYNYLMSKINESLNACNELYNAIQTFDAIPAGIITMWSGLLTAIPTGWKLCDGQEGRPNLLARFVRGISTATSNPGTIGGADSRSLTVDNMPAHTHGIASHTHNVNHSHSIPAHTHALSNATVTTSGEHRHGFGDGDGSLSWTFPGKGAHDWSVCNIIDASLSNPTNSVPGFPLNTGMGRVSNTLNSGSHSHALSGNSHGTALTTDNWNGSSGGTSLTTNNAGNGAEFDNRPAFYEVAFIIKV